MKRNVGNRDRSFRVLAAVPLLACSAMAPWPLAVRLLALAAPGVYLLVSALAGSCLGYALMGKSTCPANRP